MTVAGRVWRSLPCRHGVFGTGVSPVIYGRDGHATLNIVGQADCRLTGMALFCAPT
jgi:hypothetical protein